MKRISKKKAKDKGLKRYFTGRPCKYGHITERYVSDTSCLVCNNKRKMKYYKKHQKKLDEYSQKYQRKNKDKVNKWNRDWYNKSEGLEKRRERVRKRNQLWYRKHVDVLIEMSARYRVRLLRALPSWFQVEKKEIKALYNKARKLTEKTGIKHCVDHILPLENKFVCGLHTFANLQILTLSENSIKKNKFVVL